MAGNPALDDRIETVARRIEFLELLDGEDPLATRQVVDSLEHSRSTVTRALRELRDSDLVVKRADGYEATLAGAMAAEEYRRYEATSRAILTSGELLAAIPGSHAPPPSVLTDADVALVGERTPVRPLEAVADRVRRAEEVRAYLPTLVNTHLLRAWRRSVVDRGGTAEFAVEPELLEVLKGQYPALLSEMAAADGVSAHAGTGPPYGVFLTAEAGEWTLSVVVYEDAAVRGVLTNGTPDAVAWGRTELDRVVDGAREVTDELVRLGAAAGTEATGADGTGADGTGADGTGEPPGGEPSGGRAADRSGAEEVPVELGSQGFVRLTGEYFRTQGQAPPAVSWRTGFTLAEVRAGHALDRRDGEGRSLTDRVVEELRPGESRALLGPPGSGKSTVCMSAACEWFERGIGPVLYRERGDGDRFDSPAMLEAYLRRSDPDGTALVVVEDAVREEANAVFEVLRTLDGDPSVAFLLDARTHEWHDSEPGDVDARLDAYRRTTVETIPVPAVDRRECERFVEHFEDLVGGEVTLAGADLHGVVRDGSPATAGADSTGDALVVQHHLVRRWDPGVAAGRSTSTALEAAARRTYRDATEADADLAPEVAVLVALLTAAGVPVAREYLRAVAPAGEADAVEAAVDAFEGRLLFEHGGDGPREPTTYRTRHETWALRFLEGLLDVEPEGRARRLVGRCGSRLLALADDPERRRRIRRRLGGRTPYLHQVEADPGGWADEVAMRLFGVGCTDASLAPLFGETGEDDLVLPDACSGWTRLQVTYRRGKMHRRNGSLARAEREFRRLADLAGEVEVTGDDRTPTVPEFAGDDVEGTADHRARWRGIARTALGRVACRRGDLGDAREYHREALSLFEAAGDGQGEATSHKNLGWVAHTAQEYERAVEHLERSLDVAEGTDDRRVEAAARSNLAIVAQERGRYGAARDHHEVSLEIARERGDDRSVAQSLTNLGILARLTGEYDEARERFEEALALARSVGDRATVAGLLGNLGNVLQHVGEYDRAREHYERTLEIARESGDGAAVVKTLNNLGELDRTRGAYHRARQRHAESLAIARERGDRRGIAQNLVNLGAVRRREGAYDRARARQEWGLAVVRGLGDARGEAIALTELARLDRLAGDAAAARERLEAAAERAETTGDRERTAQIRLERARVALSAGEPSTARERARRARETFEAVGSPRCRARSRTVIGRAAAATGDDDRAREHLTAALETFADLGVYPEALESLEALVELCRDRADEAARSWCRRGEALLEAAPDPVADRHREWIERQAAALA